MEKAELQLDPKHQGIRILDISGDQLPALIRLGIAPTGLAPPSPRKSHASADKKFGLRQRSRIKKSEVRDPTVWRRWRTKLPFGDMSQKFAENEANKQLPKYFEAWQAGLSSQSVKNRQLKHSGSNMNAMNYNGVYNNTYNGLIMTQQTTPSQELSMKKINAEVHLCHQLRSNFCVTFKDYCDHCTIHGLKYIGDTALSFLERLFWIVSFVLAIMGAAYFIWHLYAKFDKSPIIISRSSEAVSIEEFPFPAVTVCNMNNAKKSVANQIMRGNDSLQQFYLDDICNFNNETSILNYQLHDAAEEAGSWENIYQFLLNVSQSCPQMLYYCEWRGNTTNCSDIFNPVLTDEGLCCKFNSLPDILYDPRVWENLDVNYAKDHIDWTPEYKFSKDDAPETIPWRAYSSGSNYGLTVALDVNADEYFCSSTASVGFKMLLHSPVEMPQIADFAFTVSPGKETRVIITPHITDADHSIAKISPKIRQCYFLGEFNLTYYRTYTQRNCVLECEANFTLEFCHCMQYYMPVTNNTRICGKDDDDCADRARRIMRDKFYQDDDGNAYNMTRASSCKCYPGCNEINYSTEISQSMLMTTFDIPPQFLKGYDEYFEKNIAVVHIFFVDTSYMKYTKNELYGFAELLSNTGGLLGLFMGFSLLSVTEIFYYFTIRLWWRLCKIRENRRNRKKFLIQAIARKHDSVYPFAQ